MELLVFLGQLGWDLVEHVEAAPLIHPLSVFKDLFWLARDMREASYYAEQFFPEHSIQYIAIADNFDIEHDNILAPFLFAMNEVYLHDGSYKVKDMLRSKRGSGQYCACPPYGYRKGRKNRHCLAPDEATAPIVERIFRQAADGYTRFFELARFYTHLEQLDRDTLATFVDRTEIGPKIYENGGHRPLPEPINPTGRVCGFSTNSSENWLKTVKNIPSRNSLKMEEAHQGALLYLHHLKTRDTAFDKP